MNPAHGFASLLFDPDTSSQICQVLGHSLWQGALLATLAGIVTAPLGKQRLELAYLVHVTALILALVALPITYRVILSEPSPVVAPVAMEPGAVPQIALPSVEAESPAIEVAKPQAIGLPTITRDVGSDTWWPQLTSLLACGYALGVLLMLLRMVRGMWNTQRVAHRATPITAGPLAELLTTLAQRWSLWVRPVLAQAERIVVPQVVGLVRPTILLPAATLTNLSLDELEMILAHELAHVRRHDLWVNLLQRLAEAVLFFNPALWYLSRRISTLREYCCDEATCRLAGSDASAARLRYAQALLRVVELSGVEPAALSALAADGRNPSQLRRRVARLFGEPLREPVRLTRGGVFSVAAGVALLLVAPVTWQSVAEEMAEQETAAEVAEPTQGKTAAQFPFGGKVEVVAIGTHGEEPQRWWNAKGKSLESVPFTWEKEPGGVKTGDKLWRRVVIRIDASVSNSPQDRVWRIVGARGSAGGTLRFTENPEPGTYLTRYFSLADETEAFGLQVGIATGEWETLVKASGVGAHSFSNKSVVFSESIASPEGVDVVVSHDVADMAYRIVAVDKNGIEHESIRSGGSSAGEISQSRATFPRLSRDDIDHFEFQTRPYEWVEIKDLPVNPGKKVSDTERWSETCRAIGELFEDGKSGVAPLQYVPEEMRERYAVFSPKDTYVTIYGFLSKERFLSVLQKRFDEIAGYENAFAGVLEGLERDPFGPQIEVEKVFKDYLSSEFVLATPSPKAGGELPKEFFVSWKLQNTAEFKKAFLQFAKSDPQCKVMQIGDATVSVFDPDTLATCVFQDQLLVASDLVLLKKYLGIVGDAEVKVLKEPGEFEPGNVNKLKKTVKLQPKLATEAEDSQITALEELIASYEAIYQRVKVLHETGRQGRDERSLAYYHLSIAQAQLAEARGQLDRAVEYHEQAVQAAQELFEMQQEVYDSGRVPLESLLQAKALRAQAKAELSQAKALRDQSR